MVGPGRRRHPLDLRHDAAERGKPGSRGSSRPTGRTHVEGPVAQRGRTYLFADFATDWRAENRVGWRAAHAIDTEPAPQIGAPITPDTKLEDARLTWVGVYVDNGFFSILGADKPLSYGGEVNYLTGHQIIARRGTGETVTADQSQSVGAWEASIGLRWRPLPRVPLQFGGGYTYSEGGEHGGHSQQYQQTGMQSNTSYFTGTETLVGRYNETLQAELGNLLVLTGFISLNLANNDASVVFENFRRDSARSPFLTDNVTATPLNNNRECRQRNGPGVYALSASPAAAPALTRSRRRLHGTRAPIADFVARIGFPAGRGIRTRSPYRLPDTARGYVMGGLTLGKAARLARHGWRFTLCIAAVFLLAAAQSAAAVDEEEGDDGADEIPAAIGRPAPTTAELLRDYRLFAEDAERVRFTAPRLPDLSGYSATALEAKIDRSTAGSVAIGPLLAEPGFKSLTTAVGQGLRELALRQKGGLRAIIVAGWLCRVGRNSRNPCRRMSSRRPGTESMSPGCPSWCGTAPHSSSAREPNRCACRRSAAPSWRTKARCSSSGARSSAGASNGRRPPCFTTSTNSDRSSSAGAAPAPTSRKVSSPTWAMRPRSHSDCRCRNTAPRRWSARSGRAPTGWVLNSRIEDLWYGFYCWEADDIVLRGNTFRDNIKYGIDPHDRSRRLIIAENDVSGTREKHGIIISREVNDSWIIGNRSHGNNLSGIVLDRQCRNTVIANNLTYKKPLGRHRHFRKLPQSPVEQPQYRQSAPWHPAA